MALPTLNHLLAGASLLKSRHGLPGSPSRPALEGLLAAAEQLVAAGAGESAALLWVLCRKPSALGDLWIPMLRVIARQGAQDAGRALRATNEELDRVFLRVATSEMNVAELADWLVEQAA